MTVGNYFFTIINIIILISMVIFNYKIIRDGFKFKKFIKNNSVIYNDNSLNLKLIFYTLADIFFMSAVIISFIMKRFGENNFEMIYFYMMVIVVIITVSTENWAFSEGFLALSNKKNFYKYKDIKEIEITESRKIKDAVNLRFIFKDFNKTAFTIRVKNSRLNEIKGKLEGKVYFKE
ncbi:MAG: hypothetical protein ACRDD2_06755 [Sarcina sp.]